MGTLASLNFGESSLKRCLALKSVSNNILKLNPRAHTTDTKYLILFD